METEGEKLVTAEKIERSEKVLALMYGGPENVPRQLRTMNVDHEAFMQWIGHRKQSAMRHYWRSYKNVDPRVDAAFNTLLMHFFLVGLVTGRGEGSPVE